MKNPHFPTPEHERAAQTVIRIFQQYDNVHAILLTNSLARGKGATGSDLDMTVLLEPPLTPELEADWDARWEQLYTEHGEFAALKQHGQHAFVHVDFFDGRFPIPSRDEAAGPDWFEVDLGNRLHYAIPMWQRSEYLSQLQAQWLPFYRDDLRQQRLAEVKQFCYGNLSYIPFYVERGLYFQAFDRLYNAFHEFLQLLFITHRTYPIAYNKWIREQIVDILKLPELYAEVTQILAISHFESDKIAQKGKKVEALIKQYVA
jgi:predicted nucleotidyltransferase